MGMTTRGGAPAVSRALMVLETLARRGTVSPAELARELNLAKSSISDLASTMLEEGLAVMHGGELAIGPLLGELTTGFAGDNAILDRFATQWPHQVVLGEHTVSVETFWGAYSLCVDARLGRYLLPYTPRAGSRLDIWNGQNGEPLLRCLAPALVKRTVEMFAAFDGLTSREFLFAWVDEHCGEPVLDALPASNGNLQLCVEIASPRAELAPPAALCLHLPPRPGLSVPDLRSALRDFAATIGG